MASRVDSYAGHWADGTSLPPALDLAVEKAVASLRRGGVVAYPTDTLYGLGAHGLNEMAVREVFRIKGRQEASPVPLLLADVSDVLRVAAEAPPLAWVLARRFWPGALTLVVPRGPAVPDSVTGGGETVAVRVPRHPVPREIARRLGAPITGTSANSSGAPGATSAEAVWAAVGERVDMVIDCGPCPGGAGSTVLDLTGELPRIVRQGPVSLESLRYVCGKLAEAP